ncbi:transcriptional regulator [Acidithiobacillus sp. IBUN Pt1247-S3]|uniref:transcriptional regulator n=1 Tax=Acidithiobacillus sp. IBUN Pt1247-S3 TaxID=3166642 RepID=UPI0034E50C13
MDDLKKAIDHFGSQASLARELGVRPMAVTHWIKRGNVPYKQAMAIERATNGIVTRSDLRPDIWPPQESQDRGAA